MKITPIIASILLLVGVVFVFRVNPNSSNQESEQMNNTGNNGAGYSAAKLDWSMIVGFSMSEFRGEEHLLDAGVVLALVKLRKLIGRIQVSPASGAISRKRPGSMHDIERQRYSLAIDIMPLDVDLITAYEAAKSIAEIGGVGVYPDWNPRPGLHIDLRRRKPSGNLAEWGGVKEKGEQIMVSASNAINLYQSRVV